jgi:membrane protease YdiL (CAAX protease family)
MPFAFLLIKNQISENTVYLFVFLGMTITYIIAYRKSLLKDFKEFKINYKKILKTTAKYWLIGLAIMLISSIIIGMLGISDSVNQDANIELFKNSPIMQAIIAIILAPIIEEIVFRRSFKDFTNNKILFAIVTGLIFGGIHVITSITNIKDLIMLIHLIPYSSVGIALGLAYKEHNNIIGTMTIHGIHNIIAIIEILFLI